VDIKHCSVWDVNGVVPFNTINPALHRKIAGILNVPEGAANYTAGKDSHGVATIGIGVGFDCGQGAQGVATGSKVILIDISPQGTEDPVIPAGFLSMVQDVHVNHGVNVHSASWKIIGYNGEYSDFSNSIDTQCFLYPALLHVFAAGNDGPFDVAAVPATCKNVLSVGATLFDPLFQAYFSSTGLTVDGRIKPDVMAPGWNVYTAECIPNSTPGYKTYNYDSGTSLATPGVAALDAILQQRYVALGGSASGYMASLRMATMLAHATPPLYVTLTSDGFYTLLGIPLTTWGTPQFTLSRMFDAANGESIPVSATATQARFAKCWQWTALSAPATLNVAVVWTDPAAQAYTYPTLVNDVDIVVSTDVEGVISQDSRDSREVLRSIRAQSFIRIVAYVFGNVPTEGPVNISAHIRLPQGVSAASVSEVPCEGTCLPGDYLTCGVGGIRPCMMNGTYSQSCQVSQAPTPAPTTTGPGSFTTTSCSAPHATRAYRYNFTGNGTVTACLPAQCDPGYYYVASSSSSSCVCVPGSYVACPGTNGYNYVACQNATGDYAACPSSTAQADNGYQNSISSDGVPPIGNPHMLILLIPLVLPVYVLFKLG
jgi:hypothetical protein